MNVDPFELAAQLADEVDGQVQTDKPLAPFTSYKIGGPTAVWVAPVTQVGVARALEVIHRKKARDPRAQAPSGSAQQKQQQKHSYCHNMAKGPS